MEQILLAYRHSEETVTAIMMVYKNTDGDTDFFDIVASVLLGNTLDPYLFIICLDYVSIDLMKENDFTRKMQETDDTSHELFWTQTMPTT